MASSGVLIDDVAAAFALPPGTITTYMQRLREHHMLHSRGRGVNAEPMEPSDASALLAAMLAGDTIAQAPSAALDALAMPRIAYGFIHWADEPPFWGNGETGAQTSPDDEAHTGTFGAALNRLIFAAERYCRLGSDAENDGVWEALFRQADDEDHHLHHDFAKLDLSDVFRASEPPRVISGYINRAPLPVRVVYCRPADLAFIDLRAPQGVRRFVFGRIPEPEYFEWLSGDPLLIARRMAPGKFHVAKQIDSGQILTVARSLQKPVETLRKNRRPK